MATLSKTVGTSVLSLQSVAASTVLISSAIDVSTKLGGTILVHFGRRNATAAGAGVNFRLEASAKSSGDGFWFPIAVYTTDFAAGNSVAVNGTCSSGQNVVPIATTTGFAAGGIIYIDNGTIANSEWGRVKSVVASTSATIEDNLLNTQTGSTVYTKAEMYMAQLDLSAISRIRLVADGSLFTQAFATEAYLITADSIA